VNYSFKELAVWCSHNNLELNTQNSGDDSGHHHEPVKSFRFLSIPSLRTGSGKLTYRLHFKKAQQRSYFLRQLRRLNLTSADILATVRMTRENK